MAAPATLKIDIIADATKAIKSMSDTSDAAEGIGGSFKKIGSVIGPALGTAAVLGFGKASVSAAQESEVATSRLEQVFRSMGDATGVAAAGAEDYASALSKKIGVEDESIMQAQAQLATFGAVSDETARQAGIFDRATAAAADLAAAGFGTLDSNAVQLGKALQDPEKGITALARSGVNFTDQQKEQIKTLVENNDLLGAQNIVLGNVEKQVGGTAEATATSTGKMSIAFGEVQEQIGGKLLPVISKLADFFTRYMDLLIPLAGVLLGVMAATKLFTIAQQALQVATGIATAVQWLWNVALDANPIGIVVLAIAAFVAGIIVLYKNVGWFRDLIDFVWTWIKDNWPLLLSILLGPFGPLLVLVVKNFDAIKGAIEVAWSWIVDNWPILLAILTGPIGIAVLFIIRNFDTLSDAAKAVVGWVSDRFQDLVGFLSRVGQTISGVMGAVVDAIKSPINAATEVYNWVVDKFNALVNFLSGIIDRVGGIADSIGDAIKAPINAVIRAWNRLEFKIPSIEPLPGVHFGGQTIGLPNIPELARGGTVLSTGLAIVHRGETFSGVGGGGGGATTINVTVQTTGLGPSNPEIQRGIVAALREFTARNGALDLPVAP